MFDVLEILPPTPASISLATRRGNAIKNEVLPAITDYERRHYDRFRKDHGTPSWVNRKPACGGYNCFGHVFATRRTSIVGEQTSQIPMIIDDDGYSAITNRRDALPGDIALYFDRRSAEYLHVAQVVDVQPIRGPDGATAFGSSVRVLSKWGPVEGEDVDHIEEVRYAKQGYDVELRIVLEGSWAE